MSTKQPRTPKELFKFKPKEWLIFNGLIAFYRLTGLWRYPIKASGDIETMTFLDKVYWLYKTVYPIRRARKNSNLESMFSMHARHSWQLPEGFRGETELSIKSVGDLINHPYLNNSKNTLYSEEFDTVFNADLAMANLECPIFPKAKGDFVFNTQTAPPLYYDLENFETVKGAGGKKFDFMATACNHSLDFGREGIEATIQTLSREGIAFHGINFDESKSFQATIIEKKDFKIGVIAFTFGLNAYKPPAEYPHIVNQMKLNDGVSSNDFRQLQAQLDDCKKQNVDFIIAHMHWGLEHEFYPVPEQVELGRHLAEMGVDAIIGHHPHVLQPVEFYTTKRDPERVVPIYYSLGNLINTFTAPYLTLSGVANLVLVKGHDAKGNIKVYVKRASLNQIRQSVDETNQKIILKLEA